MDPSKTAQVRSEVMVRPRFVLPLTPILLGFYAAEASMHLWGASWTPMRVTVTTLAWINVVACAAGLVALIRIVLVASHDRTRMRTLSGLIRPMGLPTVLCAGALWAAEIYPPAALFTAMLMAIIIITKSVKSIALG